MAPVRHDRHSIVECALGLLDTVGLPDLTMRRLAGELEVQPSALYWHFPNKQALLAAVADRILEGVSARAPHIDALSVARAIRDALLTYRDGAEVVMSTYALRLGASDAQQTLAHALGEETTSRADATFEFILGHTTLLQQRMHAQSIGAVEHDDADPTAQADAVFEAGIRALAGLSDARRPA